MKKLIHIMLLVVAGAVISSSCNNNESIAQNNAESSAKIEKTAAKNFTLSFNQGLEKAAKEKKNMIIDFYTDWCHWCKVLDEKTFRDPAVARKLSERFVTIRINAESKTESVRYKGKNFTNIELTRAFRITGFPSLGFLDQNGDVITLVPGYVPPETFIYILDYIEKECYKTKMSFEEFMKRKGECEEDNGKKE